MSKKIVRLTSTNVLRLKAVHIEPTGNVITIGGKNGQGKTSVLNSIAMALKGGSEICEKPIREGEERADTILDLGDLIVHRYFTPAGSYLQVTTKDGAKYSSPQKMLDKLVGNISFDPLEFARMAPRLQAELLRKLVGLDLSAIDSERARAFEQRTGTNRALASLQARLAATPVVDAPDQEIDVQALLEAARAADRKRQEAEAFVAAAKRAEQQAAYRVETAQEAVTAAEEQIAELQASLPGLRKAAELATDALKVASQAAAEAPPPVDAVPSDSIKQAEQTNVQVRARKARRLLEQELEGTQTQAADQTAFIARCDAERAAAIAAAKMPIEGLSVSQDGVTYRGIPFSQCSSAEQLRVSVAMGIAMNEIKTILIKDGSLLDADSMKIIKDLADAADAQIFIEVVAESGEGCSVFIEDGMVDGRMPDGTEAPAAEVVPS